MDEDFFMTTQNHFFQSESKKSMIHVCFFHFRFLMFHFSVRNNHLICHLLRYFVPFFNKKMALPSIIMLLAHFFGFLMKKQHGLYAVFFGLKNRRNDLHGKKYVHVFWEVFYITVF